MTRADAFTASCIQIIRRALRRIRVVEQGDDPSPIQISEAMEALNDIVKVLDKQGTKLWTVTDGSIACVIGTQDYTLPINVVDIGQVRIRYLSADEPVKLDDLTQWSAITEKTLAGWPTEAWLDRSRDPTHILLYPVPQIAYTLVFKQTRRALKFDGQTDPSDFPEYWNQALAFSLAATISPEYGKTIEEQRELKSDAKKAIKEAKDADRGRSDTRFVKGAY